MRAAVACDVRAGLSNRPDRPSGLHSPQHLGGARETIVAATSAMTGLRIAAYVQPRRTVGRVSGVGKHVGRLPPALAANTDVRLLAARDQLNDGRLPVGSPLAGLPLVTLPWRARTVEWCGAITGRPCLDKYVGNADW